MDAAGPMSSTITYQYGIHCRPMWRKKLPQRDTNEAELDFDVNLMDKNKKNEGVALLATIVA